MEFVTLTSVSDSYQAYFIKEELAREGIECMVVNENAANLMQYAGAIGDCVLIRVLNTDYLMANQVLEKMRVETSAIKCPNCGSANVEHGTGVKNTMTRIWMLFSFVFIMAPGRIRLSYHCNDCGEEFRKSSL